MGRSGHTGGQAPPANTLHRRRRRRRRWAAHLFGIWASTRPAGGARAACWSRPFRAFRSRATVPPGGGTAPAGRAGTRAAGPPPSGCPPAREQGDEEDEARGPREAGREAAAGCANMPSARSTRHSSTCLAACAPALRAPPQTALHTRGCPAWGPAGGQGCGGGAGWQWATCARCELCVGPCCDRGPTLCLAHVACMQPSAPHLQEGEVVLPDAAGAAVLAQPVQAELVGLPDLGQPRRAARLVQLQGRPPREAAAAAAAVSGGRGGCRGAAWAAGCPSCTCPASPASLPSCPGPAPVVPPAPRAPA